MAIKIGGNASISDSQRATFAGLNISNISEPSTKVDGLLWLDNSTRTLNIWNGSIWLPISL